MILVIDLRLPSPISHLHQRRRWTAARVRAVAAAAGAVGGPAVIDTFAEREFFATARPSSIIQRFAAPEEVASMIVYVCSAAASATTGAALRVDGGVVRAIP